jgi:hypothetical protein
LMLVELHAFWFGSVPAKFPAGNPPEISRNGHRHWTIWHQVRSASRSPPGTLVCLAASVVQPLLSRACSAVLLHGLEVQFGRPGEALKKVRVQLYLTLGYPVGSLR